MQSSAVVAKRWHAAMFLCGIGQLEWSKLVWFLTYFNTRNNFENVPYYTALPIMPRWCSRLRKCLSAEIPLTFDAPKGQSDYLPLNN